MKALTCALLLCFTALAVDTHPGVKPPCTATRTTSCTPQVSSAGVMTASSAALTTPLAPVSGGVGAQINVPPHLRYLGRGTDGAIDCNGNLSGVKNATTFNISAGHTCTVNTSGTPLLVFATGACTIAGNLNSRGVDGGLGGFGDIGGASGGSGGGAAAGANGNNATINGFLTAARGNAGGIGAAGTDASPPSLDNQEHLWLYAGGFFRGGSGGSQGGSSGGAAGPGGQMVIIACASINFTGVIDASAAPGASSIANSTGPGSGGGGGVVWLVARDSLVNTGTIYIQGGPGGQCYPTEIVFSTPSVATAGVSVSSGTGARAHVSGFSGGNPNAATVDAAGSGYNYTPACAVTTTTGGSGVSCTVTMAGVSPNMTVSSIAFSGGNGSYGSTNTAYSSCGMSGYGGLGWARAAVMQ